MGTDPATGQPILTNAWIDRLAPQAAAVLALGTCAAYGGIPAMRNNPTGAMGLRDYLGLELALAPRACRSSTCPGCPVQPDNITETLLHLVLHLAGHGAADRPRRAGPAAADLRPHGARGLRPRRASPSRAQFAEQPGDGRCLVKLGCKGPVVKCNVPMRGWVNGIGGCPNVGGICMACTMPGFPDKFMPFIEADAAARLYARRRGSPTARSSATCASAGSGARSTSSPPGGVGARPLRAATSGRLPPERPPCSGRTGRRPRSG